MGSRLELHELLKTILGSNNVYFQTPSSVAMDYPGIRYQLNDIDTRYADNIVYRTQKQYMLTLMSRDPDTSIVDELAKLPRCAFDRYYIADNLHHYVFILFF